MSWTIGVPVAALASVAAERCCADHCGEARTAKMDLDCCRIQNAGPSAPLKAPPPLAPMIVSFPLADLVSTYDHGTVAPLPGIDFQTRPPAYLEQRTLQL